ASTQPDRHLVEPVHVGYGAGMERRINAGLPFPVRNGGIGRIPNRDTLAVAMDAASRAWIRTRCHARGLASWSCAYAPDRCRYHCRLRLACAISCIRHLGHPL